jgi:hypothetical protein
MWTWNAVAAERGLAATAARERHERVKVSAEASKWRAAQASIRATPRRYRPDGNKQKSAKGAGGGICSVCSACISHW